ncbi:MAG: transketolase [Anaerolineaceae bacterium]|nr:transketolase [Anaerolineaceae bacterium]
METNQSQRMNSNALRILAMDAIQKANSGHPGLPMGIADVASTLWLKHLKFDPQNPTWINRDRFILSAGHGSMLLYSLLHLTGYPMAMDQLKQFRQWGSITPGHPELDLPLGIETTTGPLGQGIGNAVGMAIAQSHLAAKFNKPDYDLFDHWIYAITSDGELMEGNSHEIASLAGHLGLDKLIFFYDDNEISIEGDTAITFTEDVKARFLAYHWDVQEIDGHDFAAIEDAIEKAKVGNGKPHMIICHTHIAYGSPNKQDTESAHGAPLGVDEVKLTRENLGWPSQEAFEISKDIYDEYAKPGKAGAQKFAAWNKLFEAYKTKFADEATELVRMMAGTLPAGLADKLLPYAMGEKIATRAASGKALNQLAAALPELIGGSADLEPSNKTYITGAGDFQKDTPEGRNLRFGVRELGTAGIMNGIALYGALKVYGGTFMVFSDFMRPSARLAAIMNIPVIYVWTHDSIYVGEDGPTHEPVEQIMSLRLIPNMTMIRPADANETAAAWYLAVTRKQGPVGLALTRQGLEVVTDKDQAMQGVAKGAYVLREAKGGKPGMIIIATGSEVKVALDAAELLEAEGQAVRVVSMPSWELFETQEADYQESVLPDDVNQRVSIEAGVTLGWEHYIGRKGLAIGIDRFGASAKAETLQEKFGFMPDDVAARIKKYFSL